MSLDLIAVCGAFMSRKSKASAAAWRRVMRVVLLPQEAKFKARMVAYFRELFVAQIKRVAKLDKPTRGLMLESRDDVGGVLFPLDAWNRKLRRDTTKNYIDVVMSASADASDELGGAVTFDTTDPRAIEIIEQRQELLVKANQTIRRQLARMIEKGVRDGATIREIQVSIQQAFPFTAARSLTIARTEVASTANMARHEVMQAEEVASRSWSSAMDEAVREAHQEAEGQSQPMGQPFDVGGEMLMHPGDPNGSPENCISCRCVEVPD